MLVVQSARANLRYAMAFRFTSLFFWIQLIGQSVTAQSHFFIRPNLGLNTPTSRLIVAVPDPSFDSPNFDVNLNVGADFVYEKNESLQFYTGWNSGQIGHGFKFRVQSQSISGSYSSTAKYIHNSGFTVHRIPFGMQYNVRSIRWMYSKKRTEIIKDISPTINPNDVYYRLKFKIKLIAGLSLDYLNRFTDEGVPWEVNYYYPEEGQRVYYGATEMVNHRLGVAIFSGVGFNFYNLKKDHFQLTLLYSQGLIKMLTASVNYGTVNDNGEGSHYNTELGVYGSYFSAQLSYPIRLKRQAK
jgi:hypothetical protein